MVFRQSFLLGAAVGALAALLYTPLDGRDARAVLLGPFGWREPGEESDVEWTPAGQGSAFGAEGNVPVAPSNPA